MFTQRKIALAIAATLASGAVLADEAKEQQMEEVVATASPIKDSQMAAIEAKRVASNVMEVIAADTIGRFPDQNLADSLGRVPGMAIERDQGQARYINFRGMPFRYTAIGFDGVDVPGAENGRIPRFDSFPSVITSRVEVNKAVLPSMTGEAVAGYVNLKTFNPFDREGIAADLDIGMGEQVLGNGAVEKFGSRLSFSNDQFGIMGFYSKNSRDQITDNREFDMSADGAIDSIDMRSYKLTREDEAYGGHIEYRADNGNRVFISKLFSKFTDLEQRNQYVFNFKDEPVGPVVAETPVSVNRLLEDGEYNNSTDTTTLGLDYQVAGWDAQVRINKTSTVFNTLLPIIYQYGLDVINANVDVSDIENPIISTSTPVDELTYPYTTWAYLINSPMNIDAYKYKLDLSKDMQLMANPATFSMGIEYNEREVEGQNAVVLDRSGLGALGLDINSYLTDETWYSNTTNSINAMYWDNVQLRQDIEAAGYDIYPQAPANERTSLNEDITSAYVMMDQAFAWGNIVYGVRVEQTNYDSKGTLINSETGAQEGIYVEDDFINVLPSAHLNYNISEDMVARVSVSTGVNRPTYTEWRAAATVNPTSTPKTVSGGNPSLAAEESLGFDASLEYYFAPASIVSASIFSRAIDNVIYTDVKDVDGAIYGGQAGETWELSGPVNGSDGQLTGLELNFIGVADDFMPALAGWGVSANATWVSSEFKTIAGNKLDLPGTSDLIYNASVFYENHGLSARVNYQYRDEWISPIEDPTEYWGEQKRVDFNLQYQLPIEMGVESATLYFNANNLTNETDLRYAGNNTVNQSESYGRRYLAGIRLSF